MLVIFSATRQTARLWDAKNPFVQTGKQRRLNNTLEVKRSGIIIFVCAFFAAIFAANVNAQPALTPAASKPAAEAAATPAQMQAESAAEAIPQAAPTLFYIGQPPENEKNVPSVLANLWPVQVSLPVTNSMVCTWIVAALILVLVRVTTWRLKEVPTGGQNLMESLVEGWEGLMGNILEPKVTRWVFPWATTFFIFIVISNLVDLLPGVGSIGYGIPDKSSSMPFAIVHAGTPFFRPPTSDANLTVAMALVYFVMSSWWALRFNGPIGLVKHIFGVKLKTGKWLYPPLLLLFIFIGLTELVSIIIVRPVALAMRLYGNIFGGETLLTTMLTHKPVWLAVLSATPFYFFELVVCVLQAFVFAILTIAFVGTLCTHSDEEMNH